MGLFTACFFGSSAHSTHRKDSLRLSRSSRSEERREAQASQKPAEPAASRLPSAFESPLYELDDGDETCAANTATTSVPAAPTRASGVTASDEPPPASPKKKENWDEQLAKALPFSVAILSSDACQVLHHNPGTEPEAAQLLQDVLSPGTARRSPRSLPPSILARLLGAGMETEALQALALSRPWKGTITQSALALRNSLSNSSSLPKKVRWGHASGEAAQSKGLRAPHPSPLRKKSSIRMEPPVSEAPEADPVSLESNLVNAPDFIVGCGESERAYHSSAYLAEEQSSKGERDTTAHRRLPPRKSKSFNFGTPKRRASSLYMPEDAIDRLLSGASLDECSRTRSLLKGLSRAQVSEWESSTNLNLKSDYSLTSSPGLASHMFEGSRQTSEAPSGGLPKSCMPKSSSVGSNMVKDLEGPKTSKETEREFSSNRLSPFYQAAVGSTGCDSQCSLPKPGGLRKDSSAGWNVDEASQSSFDACVTPLKTSEQTKTPPFLVAIYNSSEHRRARAVLSSLAESQLELLSDLMPEHAIQFLSMESREAVPANIAKLAHGHKDATLLFMDLCGFTAFSKSVEPVQVMVLLNNLFSAFDTLTEQCRVHKLETAGDCYLVSGGIMAPDPSPHGFATVLAEQQDPALAAKRVMKFAIKALQVASTVELPGTGTPVRMRVGIHTGDCVSGLIGTKLPKFSCFGDAMNVASRMETTSIPGRIHVSEATYKLLQHEQWAWEPTGGVEVKGKGRMVTYLWIPPSSFSSDPPLPMLTAQSTCQYGRLKQACTLLQHVKSPCCSSEPLPCLQAAAQAEGGR